MIIEFDVEGNTKFIYTEELADLMEEGNVKIERASNVEHCPGGWKAYMKDGKVLGPFKLKSEAVKAEVEYLEKELFKEDECEPTKS